MDLHLETAGDVGRVAQSRRRAETGPLLTRPGGTGVIRAQFEPRNREDNSGQFELIARSRVPRPPLGARLSVTQPQSYAFTSAFFIATGITAS